MWQSLAALREEGHLDAIPPMRMDELNDRNAVRCKHGLKIPARHCSASLPEDQCSAFEQRMRAGRLLESQTRIHCLHPIEARLVIGMPSFGGD